MQTMNCISSITISQMINRNEFGSKIGINFSIFEALFINGLIENVLGLAWSEDYIFRDKELSPLFREKPLFFLPEIESSSFIERGQ